MFSSQFIQFPDRPWTKIDRGAGAHVDVVHGPAEQLGLALEVRPGDVLPRGATDGAVLQAGGEAVDWGSRTHGL